MRYEQQVSVVCDACGSKGPTRREVAVIAGQEFGRVHHPSGWRAQLVRPSVQLAGQPAGGVDPFGTAPLVAAQIGQPVETLVCPACVRKAEAGARSVALVEPISPEVRVGDRVRVVGSHEVSEVVEIDHARGPRGCARLDAHAIGDPGPDAWVGLDRIVAVEGPEVDESAVGDGVSCEVVS